jgi:toxin ParE1/3/4
MQVRWTQGAVADLERIANYLFTQTPDRAPQLVQALYEAPEALLTFPYRGRPGKKPGTRELILRPLPWILVYGARRRCLRRTHPAQCPAVAVIRSGLSAPWAIREQPTRIAHADQRPTTLLRAQEGRLRPA